ncbi:MAG: hypothetical protein MUF43_05170 [Flavobacterium sp.]|jgi:hypothetical protein|nr:hypothetical protein [Flavobacterium sp.]
MKKLFAIFFIFYSLNFCYSQTIGDNHNEVIKELLLSYEEKELISSTQVYNDLISIVEKKFEFKSPYNDYEDFYNRMNFEHFSNLELWLNNKVSNKTISNNFKVYVLNLSKNINELELNKAITQDELSELIKKSSDGLKFNQEDMKEFENFNDVFSKSYEFWKSYESGEFRSSRCNCNFGCWLKVALYDASGAIGFAATPLIGIITTVGASTFARCCIVSCCTTKRFPCEPR